MIHAQAEAGHYVCDHPHADEPLTEIGRDVKTQMDAPTVLVDRLVGHLAVTRLKHVTEAAANQADRNSRLWGRLM